MWAILEIFLTDFMNFEKLNVQFVLNLSTFVGFFYLIFKISGSIYDAIQGFRLYVLNQFTCCQVSFVERYGKWVVITGATDGIGLAMAKEFARRGHSLILIGRNERKLENARLLLEAIDDVGEIETIKIDLSDSCVENYETVGQLIDPSAKEIGVLVNNAGIMVSKFRRFNRYEFDEIRSIVNVNTLAPVFMTKLLLPSMLKQGKGLIVNVSSQAGSLAAPYMCAYGPTKAFLNSFSKLLQVEYNSQVDIINLTPGGVATKLLPSSQGSSSLFLPSAEDYATSAINALGTRKSTFCGYWPHAVTLKLLEALESIGASGIKLLVSRSPASVADISPRTGRRPMANSRPENL